MSPPGLSFSLEGKVAIITGSGKTRGIGAATAAVLAQHGAAVVINYISQSSASPATEVAKRISESGGKVKVVQADVSTVAGAQNLVDEAVAAFGGKVDILGKFIIRY
jgi:NAD(P)-dependent dehydrogenase (short-subunit alcohol dehydrogenase family)